MSREGMGLRDRLRRFVGGPGSLRRQLLGAIGGTGALYGLSVVVTFLVAVLLARALGTAELGIYAVGLALLNMLGVTARMGLGTLLLRETARALALGDWGLMRGLWRWVGRVGLAVSAAICAGVVLGAPLLADLVGIERHAVLLAGAALVPLLGLGGLISGALRGLHRVPLSVLAELVVRPGAQLALVGGTVLLWGAGSLGAERAMLLNVAATALFFAVGAGLLARALPGELRHAGPERRETRAWLRAVVPFALTAGVLQLNENVAMLMLGALAPIEEAGLYRVIVQLALLGALLVAPVHMVVAPQYARLHAEGDRALLQRLVTQTARADVLVAGGYVLGMLALGEWFLGAVFGPAFAAAHPALMIVLAGQLVAACCGPVPDILTMTGRERVNLLGTALGCAVNIGLCLLLVPRLGSLGAAVAVASGLALTRGLLALYCWRRLGIAPTPLGRR